MAQIYYQLIKRGKKTFKEVPEELKDEVKKLLEQNKNLAR